MRGRLVALWPVALLVAAPLVVWWPVTRGAVLLGGGDALVMFLPLRVFAADAWRAGELPLLPSSLLLPHPAATAKNEDTTTAGTSTSERERIEPWYLRFRQGPRPLNEIVCCEHTGPFTKRFPFTVPACAALKTTSTEPFVEVPPKR